jgi:hypothetical protein
LYFVFSPKFVDFGIAGGYKQSWVGRPLKEQFWQEMGEQNLKEIEGERGIKIARGFVFYCGLF